MTPTPGHHPWVTTACLRDVVLTDTLSWTQFGLSFYFLVQAGGYLLATSSEGFLDSQPVSFYVPVLSILVMLLVKWLLFRFWIQRGWAVCKWTKVHQLKILEEGICLISQEHLFLQGYYSLCFSYNFLNYSRHISFIFPFNDVGVFFFHLIC